MNYYFKNCFGFIKSTLLIFFTMTLILLLSAVTACQEEKKSEKPQTTSKAVSINVCESVSKQDIEQIFGVTVDSIKNTMQSSAANGQSFVSQCTYYVKGVGYKTVGIMVRYFSNENSPKSFDELVQRNSPSVEAKTEEQKKIIDKVKNSFLTGIKINDIGDIGVWYTWAEVPSLMLYFNQHYHLIINLIGFDYNDEVLVKTKTLAQKFITELK